MVYDLVLGLDEDRRIVVGILEAEPCGKFLTGGQGQMPQFQQQICRTVPDDPETVDQLAVDVVVDLELDWIMSQQNSAAAAEDFDKPVVFLREYGIKDRQQCGLVADAGDR